MASKASQVTVEQVRACLTYDDGKIKNRKTGREYKGKHSGGYVVCLVDGVSMYAHRCAWMLINGAIPEGMQIDHINGIRTDNRIENLRLVTADENARNRCRAKRNQPGITGVNWNKRDKVWHAMIWSENQHIHLGNFRDFRDAFETRLVAEVRLGYHLNHGRRANPHQKPLT